MSCSGWFIDYELHTQLMVSMKFILEYDRQSFSQWALLLCVSKYDLLLYFVRFFLGRVSSAFVLSTLTVRVVEWVSMSLHSSRNFLTESCPVH